MSIKIIKIEPFTFAFKNKTSFAMLSEFCCGVDFRPKGKHNVLISIMEVKFGDKKLIKCLEVLSEIEFPDKSFHWNFTYEIATNEEKLKEYKLKLEEL